MTFEMNLRSVIHLRYSLVFLCLQLSHRVLRLQSLRQLNDLRGWLGGGSLYSSITFRNFNTRESLVASNWKSIAQVTFGAIGWWAPKSNSAIGPFVLSLSKRNFQSSIAPKAMNLFQIDLVSHFKHVPIGLPISLTGIRKCKATSVLL